MNKVKTFMQSVKVKAAAALLTVTTAVTAAPAVIAHAEEGTANEAVVTEVTKVSKDMLATGTAVVPLALSVIALSMVVVFGIKIFKRVSTKG